MSWNLDIIGELQAVSLKVQAEQHIPSGLKIAILETIEEIGRPNNYSLNPNGVRVTTFGHFGGGYSSIGKLEVLPVNFVLNPPPIPVRVEQPPVGNAHVAEGCEKFNEQATPPGA